MAVGSIGGSQGPGATYYKQMQAKRAQQVEARREAERRAENQARLESMQASVSNVYATNYSFFDQSAQLTVQAVSDRNAADAQARLAETQASIDETLASLTDLQL